MRRRAALVVALAVLVAAAAYLRDPPWIGEVTSGFSAWDVDSQGARFRWTSGRSSFFVPSDATAMTLPLKAGPPDEYPPIAVDVHVDGRLLATLDLPDSRSRD